MNLIPLEKYIGQCLKLSERELKDILTFFQMESYPKKTILLKEGEICKFEAFIVKGFVKTYFIDKDGFEVVLTLASENWWISDLTSFQEQKPSRMFIEAIEELELLILSPQAKEKLLKNHPTLEKMFRLMVQRHLTSYQERLFENIALSAEERYDKFIKKNPQLPQRIPQHLIASYLGISPEFLSRLRKRKTKK